MGGELTGHLDAYQLNRVLIDAENRRIHQVRKPAEKPVRDKIRIIGCQNDTVKDDVLEDKCQYSSGYNRHKRPDDMPSQLLKVLEKCHLTIIIPAFRFALESHDRHPVLSVYTYIKSPDFVQSYENPTELTVNDTFSNIDPETAETENYVKLFLELIKRFDIYFYLS